MGGTCKLHTDYLFHYETKAARVCSLLLKKGFCCTLISIFPLCSQTEITTLMASGERLKTTNKGLWTLSCRVITLSILQLFNACLSIYRIMSTVVWSFLSQDLRKENRFGQKRPEKAWNGVCSLLTQVCLSKCFLSTDRSKCFTL